MPKSACMTSVSPIGFLELDRHNATMAAVRRLRSLATRAKTEYGVKAEDVAADVIAAQRVEAIHQLRHNFTVPVPFIGPQFWSTTVMAYLRHVKDTGGSMDVRINRR